MTFRPAGGNGIPGVSFVKLRVPCIEKIGSKRIQKDLKGRAVLVQYCTSFGMTQMHDEIT